MVTLHIPEGVYYNDQHGNFYDTKGKGMGGAFHLKWHTWRNYFPQRTTPTQGG